jgi:hypothetical protein
MPKWTVETRATVRRVYEVEAPDEKSAIAATVDLVSDHEEDENEETMSVTPVQ